MKGFTFECRIFFILLTAAACCRYLCWVVNHSWQCGSAPKHTARFNIFVSPGQVPSAFSQSHSSPSLSSYYLFLFIFRTKADKIRDLEFRTVSTFSGACQVSPESSAVSVSVSPYSNSRLGDSMELCEEQEKKKKERKLHMSIYISSDTKY